MSWRRRRVVHIGIPLSGVATVRVGGGGSVAAMPWRSNRTVAAGTVLLLR